MYYKKRFGQYGEKLAVRFLKNKGYKILERNYATKFGEIDIVARDGNELVFVEVKTRSDTEFGHPEAAIDQHKLWHLQRMVEVYAQDKDIKNIPTRVDAVSVEVDEESGTARIEHFLSITR